MTKLKTIYMASVLVAVIGFICCINIAQGQDKILVVEGASPDLYINHIIEPKENYYSIGRMYNVSPKELAPYNHLDFEKGLSLGQDIKIPLAQNNFIQEGVPKNGEALVPLYHIIGAKEGLYRISTNYNKVSLQLLKKWNNLSSDTVSNGTKLIVGYLQVQKGQSSLIKNEGNSVNKSGTVTKETGPVEKDKVVTAKEVVLEEKRAGVVKAADASKDKPVSTTKAQQAKSIPASTASVSFSGGRFKQLYEGQLRGKTLVSESGASGVFKSTSGWQDGKYYCFHNAAPPGTIIKITNTVNDRSIYAKVLDLIPDINENSGLILHISNSAAQELGVTDNKFGCTINYYK